MSKLGSSSTDPTLPTATDRELALQTQIDEIRQLHLSQTKIYVPPNKRKNTPLEGDGELMKNNGAPEETLPKIISRSSRIFKRHHTYQKLNLTEFNGEYNGDVFMDWLLQIETVFYFTINSKIQSMFSS